MGGFHLPEHVHFCEVQGRRVFLDLVRDRYFKLPPESDAIFEMMLLPDSQADLTAEQADALLRLGAIVAGPAGRPIAATAYPQAARSLIEHSQSSAGASVRDFLEAWSLLGWARFMIGRKRLPAVLRALQPAVPRKAEHRDETVLRFMAVRRFIPIPPNCLQDSLALSRFLRRRDIRSDLVIGVKLDPFGAHCWVQDDTIVLNDALATAQNFVPVLVA